MAGARGLVYKSTVGADVHGRAAKVQKNKKAMQTRRTENEWRKRFCSTKRACPAGGLMAEEHVLVWQKYSVYGYARQGGMKVLRSTKKEAGE